MIHRLDGRRLDGVLRAIYRPQEELNWFETLVARVFGRPASEQASRQGED
jgi:hypothetical protein